MRVAKRDGLGQLTYKSVGAEIGASDRMVVYYMPSKSELVLAVVTAVSMELQSVLEAAFGPERRPAEELMRSAWPVMNKSGHEPVFALFLEVLGHAAARVPPYDVIARMLLEGWADWLVERVEGPTAAKRREAALGIMARIDGLLLLRHGMGPEAARVAARSLGISR